MGWVSTPELTAATANAGALGILASGTLTVAETEAAIARTRELTAAPFGVNLRGDAPDLAERAKLLIKHGVRVASFALAPNERVIRSLQGRRRWSSCPSIGARRHAEKVAAWGADAVVAQGGEGGGHTGQRPHVNPAAPGHRRGRHPGDRRGRLLRRPRPRRRPGLRRGRHRDGHPFPADPGESRCPPASSRVPARAVTDTVVTTRARRRAAAGAAHAAGGPARSDGVAARLAGARSRTRSEFRKMSGTSWPDLHPRGSGHEAQPRPALDPGHHGREHAHDAPREHGRRPHRPGHARQRAGRRGHRRPADLRRADRADHGRRPTGVLDPRRPRKRE